MAKQSGLHQIRGKVGEHSYYKQTGVASGLIRSINQGLSSRVKTSEEYANTRLNNAEFGAAANVAGLLGKMVVPKFRPMILPFSQSRMAKQVLDVARQNTAAWGRRTVTSSDTSRLAAILSAQSKRDVNEFVSLSASRTAEDSVLLSASYTAEQATLLASLGVNKFFVKIAVIDMATGIYYAPLGGMTTGYLNVQASGQTLMDDDIEAGSSNSSTLEQSIEEFIPAPNHTGHSFIVFVVMPIRTLNEVDNVLQEYCSFKAIELPEYSA